LIAPENAAILAIGFAVMTVLIKVAPPGLGEHNLFVRLLPVLPVPICMGLVWIPGLQAVANMGIGDKLSVGAAIGCGMVFTYKIWSQTIRGKDERIDKAKAIKSGEIIQ